MKIKKIFDFSFFPLVFFLLAASFNQASACYWEEVDANGVEIANVMLGAAKKLAQIEIIGDLHISSAEKFHEGNIINYRMTGPIIIDNDITTGPFFLNIKRTTNNIGFGITYTYEIDLDCGAHGCSHRR